MERPTKLQRRADLRGQLPYISRSALSALLQIASEQELPTASRAEVRGARDAIKSLPTPYGTVHQTIEVQSVQGDPIKLEIQHPSAMLHHACATSDSLCNMIKRDRKPTLQEPWHLIIYADEIMPGNQLAYKSERKLWGFYWSVLEWGSSALSKEDRERAYLYTMS